MLSRGPSASAADALLKGVQKIIDFTALKGTWQQFAYTLDADGEVTGGRPGKLGADSTERLPGQSPRGYEYPFEFRIKTSPGIENALTRLETIQNGLRRMVDKEHEVFIPSIDSLHVALGGRYPETLPPLSDELIERAYDSVKRNIRKSGIGPVTIRFKGMRITKNGTIVMDVEDNPMLGRLRGTVNYALVEALWDMEEVRINRLEFDVPNPGGIVTLGRVVPNKEHDGILISEPELDALNQEVSRINVELQAHPIEMNLGVVSYSRPTREFLSDGWETERKIDLAETTGTATAGTAGDIDDLIARHVPEELRKCFDVANMPPQAHQEGPLLRDHLGAMWKVLREIEADSALPEPYRRLLMENQEFFELFILFHDIGKGKVKSIKINEEGNIFCYYPKHEVASHEMLAKDSRLAAGYPLKDELMEVVRLHQEVYEFTGAPVDPDKFGEFVSRIKLDPKRIIPLLIAANYLDVSGTHRVGAQWQYRTMHLADAYERWKRLSTSQDAGLTDREKRMEESDRRVKCGGLDGILAGGARCEAAA